MVVSGPVIASGGSGVTIGETIVGVGRGDSKVGVAKGDSTVGVGVGVGDGEGGGKVGVGAVTSIPGVPHALNRTSNMMIAGTNNAAGLGILREIIITLPFLMLYAIFSKELYQKPSLTQA